MLDKTLKNSIEKQAVSISLTETERKIEATTPKDKLIKEYKQWKKAKMIFNKEIDEYKKKFKDKANFARSGLTCPRIIKTFDEVIFSTKKSLEDLNTNIKKYKNMNKIKNISGEVIYTSDTLHKNIISLMKDAIANKTNLVEANLKDAYFLDDYGKYIDFKGIELTDANLENSYLWNLNLEGANFKGSNLKRAKVNGVNLEGANFKGANLTRTYFLNTNLSFANFENANLLNVFFWNTNLKGVNFKGANLEWANLRNANLSFANFENANIVVAKFDGANLEGANFKGAKTL